MARLYRRVGARPEPAGVAVVLLHDAHALRIERRDHPRVDAVDERRLFFRRFHVHDATARPAAMEREVAVEPPIRVGRVFAYLHDRHGATLRIRPDRAVATAKRAVAIEHPVRQLRRSRGGRQCSGRRRGPWRRSFVQGRPIVRLITVCRGHDTLGGAMGGGRDGGLSRRRS